jgi:hypothetical protein
MPQREWIAGDKHDKVAHLTFRDLLTAFAAAVETNDGEGLASLFTSICSSGAMRRWD